MGVISRGIHDRLPSESLCILIEKGEEGTGFSGRRSGEILCGCGCSKLHVEQSCILLSPRRVGPSSRRSQHSSYMEGGCVY